MSSKHEYEVIAPGFLGGVYRTPGHPKHGVVITDEPLKPVPSWLKERKVAAAKVAGESSKTSKGSKGPKTAADDSKQQQAAVGGFLNEGSNPPPSGVTTL